MFNCEKSSHKFKDMSDEEVLSSGLQALRNMYGDRMTMLLSYKRTNWLNEEYTHMAYTYVAAGGTPEDCSNIAKPINNRLYFAGEHTCF